tara:strand:+ start:89 stop:316 length:228 start_codon:yes stop_codon:yes gene_type:complete
MISEYLFFNGHGLFIWAAFAFTLICCFSLYLKTRKEYLMQEKAFQEQFGQPKVSKIEIRERKEISKAFSTQNSNI